MTVALAVRCPTPHKVGFAKERHARVAIREMRKRGKRGRGKYIPRIPYRCDCGAYHLTHVRRLR